MYKWQVDYSLFLVIVWLIIFWMIMVSSVSIYPSYLITTKLAAKWLITEPNNSFYMIKNITHVAIAFVIFAFIVKIPYQFYEKYAKQIMLTSLILLVVVLFVWDTYNWASWWLNIPWVPFSLQPTEFYKLSAIFFFSWFLKNKQKYVIDFKKWFLTYFILFWITLIPIVLQPDFWTVMVIAPVILILFFIWWWRVIHLLTSFIIWLLWIIIVYNLWAYEDIKDRNSLSYIYDRLNNFLADNHSAISNWTINYQTEQWLIAIWSWWFNGLWFWQSIQKFWYLPEAQWDFVFSVLAEELWFVWIVILLSMYLFVLAKWILISEKVEDPFAKYVAIWIVSWITIQAFINMWVNLNIAPLTWITLPFISYWWSSLLSLIIAVWVLLNISRDVKIDTRINKKKYINFRKKDLS